MPNEDQIQEAQQKKVIERLKQAQQIETISNNEKAPETASAAKMLIERLKGPAPEQQVDLSPLYALASPEVGKRLMQAAQMNKQSAFTQEEQRLSKAADVESTIAKLRTAGAKPNAAKQRADQSLYNRIVDTVSGNRRSPQLRSLYSSLDAVDAMGTKLDAALQSGTLLAADAADISSEWSRALTGGVPSQSLIEMTMPNTIYGKYNNLKTFLSSKPQGSFYTPEIMQHMSRQLKLLKGSRQKALGKAINRTIQPHRSLFERNPELAQDFQEAYEPYLNAGEPTEADEPVKQAPHGQTVVQNGKTYTWNGSSYVEAN